MNDPNGMEAEGLTAGQLESVFRTAGVLKEKLDTAKSKKSKSAFIGSFLSQNVNRRVSIEVRGRSGVAVLRQRTGQARANYYTFEVTWDEAAPERAAAAASRSAAACVAPGPAPVSTVALGAQVPSPLPGATPTATGPVPGVAPATAPGDGSGGNSEDWGD